LNPGALAGLLCLLTCLASCGGGGGPAAGGTVAVSPVTQGNATIADLVYSDAQRTPAGFALEQAPSMGVEVQTRHLRSDQLGAASATPPHELCSDDFAQALQWSDDVTAHSGDAAALTGNNTTERYFEFDRMRTGTPQTYLRERVYRCAYLDRDDTNLALPGGAAGQLNQRPLDAAGLKALGEYLWQFTPYNNFGNVVLRSAGNTSGGLLTHSLYIATLHRASTATGCDTIEVLEWKHSMNPGTGLLDLDVASLWSFMASDASGVTTLCGG
jgi:hypothetical protein